MPTTSRMAWAALRTRRDVIAMGERTKLKQDGSNAQSTSPKDCLLSKNRLAGDHLGDYNVRATSSIL